MEQLKGQTFNALCLRMGNISLDASSSATTKRSYLCIQLVKKQVTVTIYTSITTIEESKREL